MRLVLVLYNSLIFPQDFTKLSILTHWDIQHSMSFSEPWTSVHCGLQSARADRPPSSWWAAPLGRFCSSTWWFFFSAVLHRTPPSLLGIPLASERPKSPILGKAGARWSGCHPGSGWPLRPPPETGQCHTRNVLLRGLARRDIRRQDISRR